MANLNGHEAGNGGHSQGKPTAYRDSSTRREAMLHQPPDPAALFLQIRHCRKRAVTVKPDRTPQSNPPYMRAMKSLSRRSSGVLVTMPMNVTIPMTRSTPAHVT